MTDDSDRQPHHSPELDHAPWWAEGVKYVLERWGFPTLAAIAIGAFVWTCTQWLGTQFDRLVGVHATFLDRTSTTLDRLSVTVGDLAEQQASTATKVDDIHRELIHTRAKPVPVKSDRPNDSGEPLP